MGILGIGNNYSNAYQSTYASQKNEYYSYLQKNYDCVKNGSVAISGTYLKECAKNPEKAKELEESLAFFKEGYESGLRSARANARAIGARLVNYSESWSIDGTGNITMMASTTVTSDDGIKGWRERKEEGEEKLKEKREQERVGNRTVSDYASYLKEHCSCMAKGNVSISGEYLRKCVGNPEKAKQLEDFLKKIPELEQQGYEQLSARNRALGGTVTHYQQTWTVNKDGSIQSTVYSVTETGMTNAERMKKTMEERLKKQAEKKAEEKKIKEQKEEKEKQEEKMGVDIKKTFPRFDITI